MHCAVKTELMLDFEEEEDEEFENFSALHCNNCGAELASGTKFCPKCGTKVEEAQKMFCPQCGNELCRVQNSAQSAEQDACNRYKNRS